MDTRTSAKTMLVLIVAISVTIMGLCGVYPSITIVQGKVLSIQSDVFSRGTITVKSDQTEKTYTFYVGNKTAYYPSRYPSIGETVKVSYIDDRGFLKASRVDIVQGP